MQDLQELQDSLLSAQRALDAVSHEKAKRLMTSGQIAYQKRKLRAQITHLEACIRSVLATQKSQS